ncbi:PREDICTED: tRNA (guanine-N(7)-)-methyltransferase non-catalytic subunit WDR4 [Tinamus guttatus]|uniref:tRNA (guanine-N(7)-)-methyltransferase non-catalytic subunit WDR4 n=1 Tax=Tinamus guttatus TaxID=94827 RepID=UPI00052F0B45|nr:PREDICTED: tRNA (guanine-N(7)-)-methyltransferase non-catalytic subunit WDR4 [Tinamus guttatus]
MASRSVGNQRPAALLDAEVLFGRLFLNLARSRSSGYRRRFDDGLFVYDCINAEKKTVGNKGQDGQPADKGSDDILAFAFSLSGNYFALTDDNKRLILFHTTPSWECVSVRFQALPSFAALSPDDRYILTADRDEKIRVSLAKAPHNIVSYCLGHKEFVSKIFVIPNYPDLLLSASGDSTVRLWEYKIGKEVFCCDLSSLREPEATQTNQRYTVSRIAYCCRGGYVAVICDCIPTVYIFQLDAIAQQLVYRRQISLEHKGWDVAFEETGDLWILQESKEAPLLLHRPEDGQWKPVTDDKGLQKMSKYLHDNWTMFEGFVGAESHYSSLYKASFDNMATYLQRKEERLQQQKKRKDLQHGSNGQAKKIKTEEPSL